MPDLRHGCSPRGASEDTRPADVLVLFGAMGDLAHKKIFPALYHMVQRGHMDLPIIGVAKAGRTDEQLKERARDSVHQQGGNIDEDALAKLLNLLHYAGGDYQELATFDRLKKALGPAACPTHYLAIPPSLFITVVSRLSWKWRKRSSVKIAERTYEEKSASTTLLKRRLRF